MMMKRIFLLLITLAIATGTYADEALKREMRAAWVATVYRITRTTKDTKGNS